MGEVEGKSILESCSVKEARKLMSRIEEQNESKEIEIVFDRDSAQLFIKKNSKCNNNKNNMDVMPTPAYYEDDGNLEFQ